MFICLFVCLWICLFLIIIGHQQKVFLKVSWRSDLIWLGYLGYKKHLFLCWFIDLFVFYFNHIGAPAESYLENMWQSDLIWLGYLGSKTCLFVCWFVFCLLTCMFFWSMDLFVFCFNHHGTPKESFPERFLKIWLDLVEIFKI